MQNNKINFGGILRYISISIAIFLAFLLICAFVLPLIFSIIPIFSQNETINFGSSNIYSFKYIFNALVFTIKQAFFSTVIAMVIGVPMGFFVSHREFPLKKFFVSYLPPKD